MEAQDGLAELREEAFVFVELIAALASWASSGMLPSMDVRKAFKKPRCGANRAGFSFA